MPSSPSEMREFLEVMVGLKRQGSLEPKVDEFVKRVAVDYSLSHLIHTQFRKAIEGVILVYDKEEVEITRLDYSRMVKWTGWLLLVLISSRSF